MAGSLSDSVEEVTVGLEPERKKVIIKEILEWRRSRLLPEQYCDFLLNLYQDDPDSREDRGWHGLSAAQIRKGSIRSWALFFGIIVIIFLFSFNFNSFHPALQIAVLSLAVMLCYGIGLRLRSRLPALASIAIGAASLLLLSGGISLLRGFGAEAAALVIYGAVCAVVWMVAGLMARFAIFHFCGWILLALVYGWFLNQHLADIDWIEMEMAWIPAGILLVWVGWLLHRRHRSASAVLLAVGSLLWFAPEVYGYLISDLPKELLQLGWIGKLLIVAALLYVFRKKWTEWVA
ncbi:hypothetical protein [Paenibacillus sp. J2TS4]|uniref:hypothetical protein n=1 Tax=Paenibacillus sp. J2TS4 TaxID=2807194 RepID=UPI001B0B8099|nr:hypothetical protein [Paenibacillus sp. J2TS4]GIP35818.1 hypothetical protein J2TS4_50280 [Paenibacillus sp. J2TS4]